MSGGSLLELSTNFGQQAARLTDRPQVTFWKQVHRRHTNFSTEHVQVTFQGSTGFNQKMIAIVPRTADLINKTYLYVTMPALVATGGGSVSYTRNLGNCLIKKARVVIGPTIIDEQSGIWMYIWHQFTEKSGHVGTYDILTGNTTDATIPTTGTLPAQNLYIPLDLFFTTRPGLSIPLLAISFAETRIEIETNTLESLVILGNSGGFTADKTQFTASLWIKYVHLDEQERLSLTQRPMEILYEETQYTGDETVNGQSDRKVVTHVHPIKTFYFVFSLAANQAANRWTDFTDNGAGNNPYAGGNILASANLQIYNTDRFSRQDGNFFNLIQAYEHFPQGPAVGIYCYNLCLNPTEHQPSGTLNMSKVDNAAWSFTFTQSLSNCLYMLWSKDYNIVKIMNGLAGRGFANRALPAVRFAMAC